MRHTNREHPRPTKRGIDLPGARVRPEIDQPVARKRPEIDQARAQWKPERPEIEARKNRVEGEVPSFPPLITLPPRRKRPLIPQPGRGRRG